jgi:hypothetical protein
MRHIITNTCNRKVDVYSHREVKGDEFVIIHEREILRPEYYGARRRFGDVRVSLTIEELKKVVARIEKENPSKEIHSDTTYS